MSERKTEYRIMIHPSGELHEPLKEQLSRIAKDIYRKETDDVIYRIKTVEKQSNPRKLFVPGEGEIIEAEVPPHMALGHKFLIDEQSEEKVLQKLKEITLTTKPFTLISTKLGDYGEDFTIFTAFSQSDDADHLVSKINEATKSLLPNEIEKWDTLHFTLVYDDASSENIEKT